MTTIVFSKDRALQLDAFLRSYEEHVCPCDPLHVLRLVTTRQHDYAYAEVFRRHQWAIDFEQSSFKSDLLDILSSSGNVVFFVDDQVFIRPWTVVEQPGLSLRLGMHLTHCYPTRSRQLLPPLRPCNAGQVSWLWSQGDGDWGYPLSLDGHVFDLAEMRSLIETVAFTSPNTLEAALQQFLPMFVRRPGVCYRESRVINVPWNRVQTDYVNRCAGVNAATSADELLEVWEQGQQIDVKSLYGVLNESAHQEFPLVLEPRV